MLAAAAADMDPELLRDRRIDRDHQREVAVIAEREAADPMGPGGGIRPALAPLPLSQVVPLVVVEVGWHVARVVLQRRGLERSQMHAVPLRAVHEVDVLEAWSDRFERLDQIAQ